MRDSASKCQEKAQAEARFRTGTMRRMIALIPTKDGAIVEGQSPIFIFHEYGTGEHAGDADQNYPEQRASTGSKAKEIPWVYYDEEARQFFTTTGVRPKPMLRPGFREGVEEFKRGKRRRGL